MTAPRNTGHGHGHGVAITQPVAPKVRNLVVAVIVPFIAAAIAGMVLLWPSGERPESQSAQLSDATILGFEPCDAIADQTPTNTDCQMARVVLGTGPGAGSEVVAFMPFGEGAPEFAAGDEVVVAAFSVGGEVQYEVSDFQRSRPLLILAVMFAVAVVVLSRWRGLAALAGLGFSILVLTVFILPALLDGRPPLAVAVVGAAVIMVGAMYLTHGVSVRTSVALLGTLISLSLTGLLGYIFTDLGRFVGFLDEGTGFLRFLGVEVDSRGLLLAGLVIGALGVLNDVTVTQTMAVWEVAAADPSAGRRKLLAAGLRIGREHVGATVNTLVLAYVGASLPVLLLLVVADQGVVHMVTTEVVAQEVVRALVGSLGIVAAVPVTTALAAFAVRASAERQRGRRAAA